MTTDTDDQRTAGTVPQPEYRRAGCGIRFEEGALKAGIDFSGASQLLYSATGGLSGDEETPDQENTTE